MKRILTEEQELELINYYKTHSNNKTATVFHVHFNPTVIKLLEKYNIKQHTSAENTALALKSFKESTQYKPDKSIVNSIIEYYKSHSDAATAHTFNLRISIIRRILQESGIKLHTKDENTALGVIKNKQTCLEHFGTDSPLKSQTIKAKVAATNLERYGNVCSLHDNGEISKKTKKTNLEKYGAENPFGSDAIKIKIKQTTLDRYGVEHYSQLDIWHDQVKQTTLEHFGTEWYNQSTEAAKNHRKLYHYENETFDSFPELCFYLYHIKNNIEIERCPVSFKYVIDDEEHFYIPDFRVNNELYEIKGSQFLREDGTWHNPFDESDSTYEAKHQCALNNNVKILYTEDYKKYVDWFESNHFDKTEFC